MRNRFQNIRALLRPPVPRRTCSDGRAQANTSPSGIAVRFLILAAAIAVVPLAGPTAALASAQLHRRPLGPVRCRQIGPAHRLRGVPGSRKADLGLPRPAADQARCHVLADLLLLRKALHHGCLRGRHELRPQHVDERSAPRPRLPASAPKFQPGGGWWPPAHRDERARHGDGRRLTAPNRSVD